MTLCEIFQAPLQPATPISSSAAHQNFCTFLSLCYLLSYYSRDTFSKRKNETKFENKNSLIKKSLYYTEKNFNFVRVFFKILYTLFTFDFTIAKKYPSIIQRKIRVLSMCFERKFTSYFFKTKILTVLSKNLFTIWILLNVIIKYDIIK